MFKYSKAYSCLLPQFKGMHDGILQLSPHFVFQQAPVQTRGRTETQTEEEEGTHS